MCVASGAFFGGGGESGAKRPKAGELAAFNFEAAAKLLAKKAKREKLQTEELPEVPSSLTYKEGPAMRLPGKRGILQRLLKCADGRCLPYLVLADDESGHAEVRGSASLPGLRRDAAEMEYLPLGLADIDRDGKEELLIRYKVHYPAREGTGLLWNEILVVVNLPDMTVALQHELASGGSEKETDRCSHSVTVLDLDGDKRNDLRVQRVCVCGANPTCSPAPAPPEEFITNSDRRFVLRKASAIEK